MNNQIFQLFCFKKPIEIVELPPGSGNTVVALGDKIVLHIDPLIYELDMLEILSRAKMAEQDPLLVTFVFQKDLTIEEEKYAYSFHQICRPLIDAWTYKTMRKYSPYGYKKEIDDLLRMYMDISNNANFRSVNITRHTLSLWAILMENPEYSFIIDSKIEESLPKWKTYVDFIRKHVSLEPDVYYLTEIPDVVGLPYSVNIDLCEDNTRYYKISKK